MSPAKQDAAAPAASKHVDLEARRLSEEARVEVQNYIADIIDDMCADRGTPRLNAALAKAQGEFEAIKKDKEADAGKYTYKYADAESVAKATRAPLAKYGLSVSCEFEAGGMRTWLRHESGEERSSFMPLNFAAFNNPQQLGSFITYFRRYMKCAILDVQGDEDDDAGIAKDQAAHQPQRAQQSQPQQRQQQPRQQAKANKLVTEPQLKRLFAKAQDTPWTEDNLRAVITACWGLTSFNELSMSRYDALINWVETMPPEEWERRWLEKHRPNDAPGEAEAVPVDEEPPPPDEPTIDVDGG